MTTDCACPQVEQLERFLTDRSSGPEPSAVVKHVETCSRCQAWLGHRVEGLAQALFQPGPAPANIRRDGVNGLCRVSPLHWMMPAPLPVVPGYTILEELGRGGMGVVYKARQEQLGRVVALKILPGSVQVSPLHRARFRAEAESVARLSHPNIVQVYDVGEHAGTLYMALEYVAGGTLAGRLTGQPLPPPAAAELVAALARAVHYAHVNGIVHRDLKPANILLQRTDKETRGQEGKESEPSSVSLSPCLLVSLSPKIADFGLAKRLDAAGQTSTGAVVGTPSYMAPEQAAGLSNQVGAPADVYALGVILYELLTGRPPFRGASPLATLVQVSSADAVPPGRLQPGLPRDLETVCLRCLEKEPARRYTTAGDLADDLERFLRHEPIRARPAGWVERGVKWARRRPAQAALVGVTLVALVGFLTGGVFFSARLAAERRHALDQESLAREALTREAEQGYAMRIALAQREVHAGQPASRS
jgi:hypothetical protein